MAKRRYFGTDGIRGRTGQEPITAEFALKLGWAVGQVLSQDGYGTVLIGKDTRISGYMLSASLQAGLIASGLDVWLLGPIPTPGVAYLTHSLGAQVGVVVSASHNPYYDNGIKFFSSEGKKLPDSIEAKIESFLDTEMTTVSPEKIGRAKLLTDAKGRYIEYCKSTFAKGYDLRGMKIVVDCANGAAYHIAPHVLAELGADVIAINCEPNGFNINENCGSTSTQGLQQAVIEHHAELGIALDGDGDRVIMVDNEGTVVDGDELLFIIAMRYKRLGLNLGGVVGTLMSNLGLEQALKAEDIAFARANVGDRYVLDKLERTGWVVGGESSGHIICLDKSSTGDGIVAALQVLIELVQTNRSLKDLRQMMTKRAQALHNVAVTNAAVILQDPSINHALRQHERDLGDAGRILLRPSGTEPLLRIMVEGENEAHINAIAADLAEVAKAASIKVAG